MCTQMTFIKDPRPDKNNESVIKEAVDMLYPDIAKWLVDGGDKVETEEEIESIKKDVVSSVKYSYCSLHDAYEICKHLDGYGWVPDQELVDIMSNFSFKFESAYSKQLLKWIGENNIRPKFSVGDKVKFKVLGGIQGGEISKVYEDRAQYSIYCESLGHVKTGTGTHGVILNFEDVEELNKEMENLNEIQEA